MSKSNPQIPIRMGEAVLERVSNFCYLGIYFDYKGFDKKSQVKALCAKALKSEKFFKNLGMNGNGWHLASKISVFKSFIRSKLEYGMAILNYSKREIDQIDKV